jgi:hypothetical protein
MELGVGIKRPWRAIMGIGRKMGTHIQEDFTDIQFRRNARWAAQGTQKAVAEARKAAKASA